MILSFKIKFAGNQPKFTGEQPDEDHFKQNLSLEMKNKVIIGLKIELLPFSQAALKRMESMDGSASNAPASTLQHSPPSTHQQSSDIPEIFFS